MSVEWSDEKRKLTVRRATYASRDGGEPVRVADVSHMAMSEMLCPALEAAVLGDSGSRGLVERHRTESPAPVDALVYQLAVAIGSPKPSATVAFARGLSPATGPGRVAARREGLLPAAEPGRASA